MRGSADTNIIRSESEHVNIEVVPLDEAAQTEDTHIAQNETVAAISTNPSPGAARSTATVSYNRIRDRSGNVNPQCSISNPERRRDVMAQLSEAVRAKYGLAPEVAEGMHG